jgi:hypothetical protein
MPVTEHSSSINDDDNGDDNNTYTRTPHVCIHIHMHIYMWYIYFTTQKLQQPFIKSSGNNSNKDQQFIVCYKFDFVVHGHVQKFPN